MFVSIYGDNKTAKQDELVLSVRKDGVNVKHSQPRKTSSLGLQYYSGNNYFAVTSPVDGRAKFSTEYAQCIGVVAIATEKISGRQLSVLCHTDPRYFMGSLDAQTEFRKGFQETLCQLVDRTATNTLEILIFGGETKPHWKCEEESFQRRIGYLYDVINSVTGCVPIVMLPKFSRPFNTQFYLATQERRAVLVQPLPKEISIHGSFAADAVEAELEKWRKAAQKRYGEPLDGCYPFIEEW